MPRRALLSALQWARVPSNLISIIIDIHCVCRYRVVHEGFESFIDMKNGVRQGCTLAPILWSLYSVFLLRQEEEAIESSWPREQMTLYADDTRCAWRLQSERDLNFMIKRALAVFDVYRKYGMQINPDKSTLIIKLGGTHGARWLKQHVHVHNGKRMFMLQHGTSYVSVPISKQSKYLGIMVSYHNFEQASLLHCSKYLRLRQRLQIYTACVRSTFLYGLPTIGLSDKDLMQLHRRDIKYLRAVAKSPVHLTREPTEQLFKRLQVTSIRQVFLKLGGTITQKQRDLPTTQTATMKAMTPAEEVKEMFQEIGPAAPTPALHKRETEADQTAAKESVDRQPKYPRPTSKGQGQGKGLSSQPAGAAVAVIEEGTPILDALNSAAEAFGSRGRSDNYQPRDYRQGGWGNQSYNGQGGNGNRRGWNNQRGQQYWGRRENRDQQFEDKMEESIKMLTRLCLRHEDELSQMRTERDFILTFETRSGAALPKMYKIAMVWKEKKEQNLVDCSLRQALFIAVLQMWHERMRVLEADEDKEAMEKIEDVQPMLHSHIVTSLDHLQQTITAPHALLKFHSTRRMAESYQGETAWVMLTNLCGCGASKVLGLRLWPAKMDRQPLAKVLAERFLPSDPPPRLQRKPPSQAAPSSPAPILADSAQKDKAAMEVEESKRDSCECFSPIAIDLTGPTLQHCVYSWYTQANTHALAQASILMLLALKRFRVDAASSAGVLKDTQSVTIRAGELVRIPGFDSTAGLLTTIVAYVVMGVVFHIGETIKAGHYRSALSGSDPTTNQHVFHLSDDNSSLKISTSSNDLINSGGYLVGLRRLDSFSHLEGANRPLAVLQPAWYFGTGLQLSLLNVSLDTFACHTIAGAERAQLRSRNCVKQPGSSELVFRTLSVA
ncbi:unnamed protein product [Symbiodinium microadriaticum]|nr:unnamed protein product [Symbiodinium microadriaticum]